jgi:hypothetical protein
MARSTAIVGTVVLRAELASKIARANRQSRATVRAAMLEHLRRARLRAIRRTCSARPSYALYAVLDFVVDNFFPIVREFREELQELEEEVFQDTFKRETISVVRKKELVTLRLAIAPIQDIANQLSRQYPRRVGDELVGISRTLRPRRCAGTTCTSPCASVVTAQRAQRRHRLQALINRPNACRFRPVALLTRRRGTSFPPHARTRPALGVSGTDGHVRQRTIAFAVLKRAGWL